MSDRDSMLNAIRSRRLGTRPHPDQGPVPSRGRVSGAQRTALFKDMCENAATSVDVVAGRDQVPGAVARYLRQNNLPARLRLAPDPAVRALDWASHPMIAIEEGPSNGGDVTSVTPAFAGVAETGTLALASGPGSPTSLNFLPENHIVVLGAGEIVGSFEELWTKVRERFGTEMPRTLNLVTGPSRSADIEQTLLMGAHGPKRLHIVLVDD